MALSEWIDLEESCQELNCDSSDRFPKLLTLSKYLLTVVSVYFVVYLSSTLGFPSVVRIISSLRSVSCALTVSLTVSFLTDTF